MIIKTIIKPITIESMFMLAPNNPIPVGSMLADVKFNIEKQTIEYFFMNFVPDILKKYKDKQIITLDTNWRVETGKRPVDAKEITEKEITNKES